MKKKLLTTAALLLLCPLAAPNSVLCQDLAMNMEDETLAMYFDLDEMVEAPTGVAKHIRQVAENVTIVTAQDIERMNAHNVAEVLNRVPGVFVQFNGRGFNTAASIHIQDSDFEHVLVLIDGIRWNDINAGMAVTAGIPVEIISRIEVIKGPASSTWGSALGGVINIITKKAGTASRPSGTLYASYGEYNSQEYHATLRGKAGGAGYFLSAGSQSSDGFLHNRNFDRKTLYGKVDLNLPNSSTLTVTSGYSEPEQRSFDWAEYDFRAETSERNFWSTVTFDSNITEKAAFSLSAFRYEQKFINNFYDLATETLSGASVFDNLNTGISGRLNVRLNSQEIVFGSEIERSQVKDKNNDRYLDETWSLYVNDTFTFGKVSITPGIRYDHLSLSDNFVSPSLGLTWQVTENTLLRALVAKGFRKPYIFTVRTAVPGIKPEKVTSYEAGFETTALPSCRLKATFFSHNVKDEWIFSDSSGWLNFNGGKAKRYGYELELETVPVQSFSAIASFTYVYTDYYGYKDNDDSYSAKTTLRYDNPDMLKAELFGRYMWWNEDRAPFDNPPEYGTMIWDLSLTKPLQINEGSSMDLFLTAHNLFDGRDYWIDVYDNAHRWLEAGIKFHF